MTSLFSVYRRTTKNKPSKEERTMEHNLKINVSKTPQKNGMVSCKTVSVKERLLKKLFGETRKEW